MRPTCSCDFRPGVNVVAVCHSRCHHCSMQGLPPNPTDLRAKPAKEDEKWERFHLIKCECFSSAGRCFGAAMGHGCYGKGCYPFQRTMVLH